LTGVIVPIAAWTQYLKVGSALYNSGNDLFGNAYGTQSVDALPMVPTATFATLSDVADSTFFSPYRTQ
jgi:hypothetical protein